MLRLIEPNDQETDQLRLDDLVTEHGIAYSRVGNTYIFEDFMAHGLEQALGFAEGFDRGRGQQR
jgi:hypothetical protein